MCSLLTVTVCSNLLRAHVGVCRVGPFIRLRALKIVKESFSCCIPRVSLLSLVDSQLKHSTPHADRKDITSEPFAFFRQITGPISWKLIELPKQVVNRVKMGGCRFGYLAYPPRM